MVLMLLAMLHAALAAPEPLHLIVMDPLALPLSCACVPGTGQRRYDQLAEHLASAIGRPVKVTFDEGLALAMERTGGSADLIIGKDSVIRADAAKMKFAVRPLAGLTDNRGGTTLRGVFLVRKNDPAKVLADLAGKTISLGPPEDDETHSAATRALKSIGAKLKTAGSIDAGALALHDGETDAAVVSDFLPPLLEGCGKLDKGSVRILAETEAVPFIRVFATAGVNAELEQQIMQSLAAVAKQPTLLTAMESKSGFTDVRAGEKVTAWPDWRGPERKGFVPQLPANLPARLEKIWSSPLTGPALAGAAATEDFVIVPDKSADSRSDIFRCLAAKDGKEIWKLEYDAPDNLEYSNAPRATPVMHDGLVYLQGALGHLHCVKLATGKIVWKRHLFADFKAVRLNWGASVAPLVVGDKLIIAPGAKAASLVALDRKTGTVLWQTPGHAAAYSAFISGTFDNVPQIIGYDAAGFGGWDPQTGKRLWELVPPDGSDFNVTTPVIVGGKILLATENNATRLYRFDGHGALVAEPAQRNTDLAPDTCTPAIAHNRAFATAYGELMCLDLADGLRTLWRRKDDMFHDHCNIVASRDRLLAWTADGDLLLLDATAPDCRILAHLRPFDEKHPDTLAHPAFTGDRIYLRSRKELACFRLTGE